MGEFILWTLAIIGAIVVIKMFFMHVEEKTNKSIQKEIEIRIANNSKSTTSTVKEPPVISQKPSLPSKRPLKNADSLDFYTHFTFGDLIAAFTMTYIHSYGEEKSEKILNVVTNSTKIKEMIQETEGKIYKLNEHLILPMIKTVAYFSFYKGENLCFVAFMVLGECMNKMNLPPNNQNLHSLAVRCIFETKKSQQKLGFYSFFNEVLLNAYNTNL